MLNRYSYVETRGKGRLKPDPNDYAEGYEIELHCLQIPGWRMSCCLESVTPYSIGLRTGEERWNDHTNANLIPSTS